MARRRLECRSATNIGLAFYGDIAWRAKAEPTQHKLAKWRPQYHRINAEIERDTILPSVMTAPSMNRYGTETLPVMASSV